MNQKIAAGVCQVAGHHYGRRVGTATDPPHATCHRCGHKRYLPERARELDREVPAATGALLAPDRAAERRRARRAPGLS